MLSPRRSAQLGLSAACLLLVACVTILVAGAAQPPKAPPQQQAVENGAHVTPLATGQLGSAMPINQSVTLAK